MSNVDSLPPIRDVIAKYGLLAKKSLGQNFLTDLNLACKIAHLAGDLTTFDILEVGAGPGGLTRGLLASGARRVLAIEKDRRCLPALEDIKAAYPDRFRVLYADALDVEFAHYLKPPVKIIANLPYNIGTALLINWLTSKDWPPIWTTMTIMFQREVAERITASHGSRVYGRLSILAQWRSDVTIAKTLPPDAFTPRPKIASAVVHFRALPTPRFPADPATLQEVVGAAFSQRRKMIRTALKKNYSNLETALEASGISPTDRAERISLEQYCTLARELSDTRRYRPQSNARSMTNRTS